MSRTNLSMCCIHLDCMPAYKIKMLLTRLLIMQQDTSQSIHQENKVVYITLC
ncbi:hypothetical protein IHE45_07G029300 [Dioscorea alata]|uniref:Uncharacterized protein n=1 Tax=Dioscorea alata TaxID=55571 RepID=A0ACB7VPQ9_DIOAL|nr:hypothetical protein IHE45_07G029300 [Dioscorea alata]